MRRFYYAIKRQVRPLLCLFGRHDYKMGLTDKTGRPFACLWCRKGLPKQATTDKTFRPMTDILCSFVPTAEDEIQALRKKHHREQENGCVECGQLWPCDVIKALDTSQKLINKYGPAL